jgi:nitrite reductase/ring-hydroxylating ferredoxin subunit
MARDYTAHAKAKTISQAADVMKVPATNYYDEERWKLEVDRIFKRMPLVLATTAELRDPGDYKSIEAVGVPVIMSRGKDGEVRAFVNACRHRGAQILPEGTGTANKFTCPYHAWTFSQEGDLVAIAANEDFGDVDKSCHNLIKLPVLEKAGLIWVILDPKSTLSIETFLSGYDELLGMFGFETWHMFDQRTLRGPNWKIAYDGYLDFYHLPVLHKDTFGAQMSNQALYYNWGPHQRVSMPDPSLAELPEDKWPTEAMLQGVWTIFPHVSIASFDGGGGRGVMISCLFPGDTPGESFTIQNYLMEKEPTGEQKEMADAQFKLLEYVVQVEDYETGLRQQKSLETGVIDEVMFGRNEGGGQRFHGWVERLLAASDNELPSLFQKGAKQAAE